MIVYRKTFENVKKSNINFPVEDQYYTSDNEAIVADGITRDPEGVDDISSCPLTTYIERYPKPSGAELVAKGLYVPICTIITQTRVDAYDDAFFNPTKSIGQPMEKEQADEEVKKGHTMKETPAGFYKMVASPEPLEIVELDSIRALTDAGHIVIACGGGGIPVIEQNQHLKGASAVIEKDIAAAKLAKDLDADIFMILTNVDKVCLNYKKDNETALDELSIQDAAKQIEAGQFEEGTMLPKIQAAISFSGAKEGRQTIISSLDKAVNALHGKTGTVIRK